MLIKLSMVWFSRLLKPVVGFVQVGDRLAVDVQARAAVAAAAPVDSLACQAGLLAAGREPAAPSVAFGANTVDEHRPRQALAPNPEFDLRPQLGHWCSRRGGTRPSRADRPSPLGGGSSRSRRPRPASSAPAPGAAPSP